MSEKLKKAEERTDNLLQRVIDLPYSFLLLVCTHAACFVLGAFLFGG